MLQTLNDFLMFSIKITDKDGGQLFSKIVHNHHKKLQESGLIELLEIEKLDESLIYKYDDNDITEPQKQSLIAIENIQLFCKGIASNNVPEDQLDLLLDINYKVSIIVRNDSELHQFTKDIRQRVESGEALEFHKEMLNFKERVKQKILSDLKLQTEFFELMLSNVEILKKTRNSWEKSFIELLKENKNLLKTSLPLEIVKRIGILTQGVHQSTSLKKYFVTGMTKILEVLRLKSCARRMNRESALQPAIDLVNKLAMTNK